MRLSRVLYTWELSKMWAYQWTVWNRPVPCRWITWVVKWTPKHVSVSVKCTGNMLILGNKHRTFSSVKRAFSSTIHNPPFSSGHDVILVLGNVCSSAHTHELIISLTNHLAYYPWTPPHPPSWILSCIYAKGAEVRSGENNTDISRSFETSVLRHCNGKRWQS